MIWQDFILTIINFGFILTVIPAIIRNYKIKNATSQSLTTYCSTAILLTLVALIFYSLELILSSFSTAGSASMWYILTYQKLKYK